MKLVKLTFAGLALVASLNVLAHEAPASEAVEATTTATEAPASEAAPAADSKN